MDANGCATMYMSVGGKAKKGLQIPVEPDDTGTVRVEKILRASGCLDRILQPNDHYVVTRTQDTVTVTFPPRKRGHGVCLTGRHHVLRVVMERARGPDVPVAYVYVKTKPKQRAKTKPKQRAKTVLGTRKRCHDDEAVTVAEFEVFKANITKRLRALERAWAARRKAEAQQAKQLEAIERTMRAEFMDEINALDRLNCPLPYAHA